MVMYIVLGLSCFTDTQLQIIVLEFVHFQDVVFLCQVADLFLFQQQLDGNVVDHERTYINKQQE